MLLTAMCLLPIHAQAQKTCPALQFDGEVQAGKTFSRRIDRTHVFLLESIASGWIVRVLRTDVPRGAHDGAELATPPYRSPSPLLISTDFSFRAQDAIAWNPREFHYFPAQEQILAATRIYDATLKEPNRPAAGAALFPMLASACTAELRILDASLSPGTADQSRLAAGVAQHLAATPHTFETSASPSKLGSLLALRFRVRFEERR